MKSGITNQLTKHGALTTKNVWQMRWQTFKIYGWSEQYIESWILKHVQRGCQTPAVGPARPT
jgi:hypothetical protein